MAIFTFFGAFSHFSGSVFGHFSDIFGIRWDFLGTPAIYFVDFRAILAIFDHFWPIFGPFLGRNFFWLFFAEKWHFGPGIRAEAQKRRAPKSKKWPKMGKNR